MLGDWVQDYPGDLSNHETYALLWSFYERLLQHSSTTYVAAPLRSFVEAARNAPDPDAVWSKLEDSVQPASVAAQHPPLKSHQSEVDSASAALKSASSKGTDVSSSAAQTVRQEGSNSFEESGALVRAPSDGSSSGVVDVGHLAKPADDTHSGRQRSASDLTTSSNEGQRSALSVAGGSSSNTSSSNLNSAAPSSSSVAEKPQDQKPMLRSISNALAELDDELIAAQLSRLEWDLFSAIRPRDLLRHILVSRDVREKNGPVARSIAHFNYISSWVCSMILVQGKTKHRARMLEKFMNVAAILRHDNNYNTLHSVLAGLGNASVHRLKHTRELLTGKPVNKTYQSLARLMGSDRSFAAYRLALENSEGRTIPYLGVHLQDILSISDGNPSKRASDGMVHWKKFSLMDEAVMVIVKCQQYERVTRPNAAVERLIMDVPVMDEEVSESESTSTSASTCTRYLTLVTKFD